MKFCCECGASVIRRVPAGDNLPRFVCERCDTIHYQNPKIVAGCIPLWEGKILLCRRSIEPRYGYWTVPAGFMELGESTLEAARREAWEEARAEMEDVSLFGIYHLKQISQVYVLFAGRLAQGKAAAGEESLEVRLFDPVDIPWHELAFSVVDEALRQLLTQRREGRGEVMMGDILRRDDGAVEIHRHEVHPSSYSKFE